MFGLDKLFASVGLLALVAVGWGWWHHPAARSVALKAAIASPAAGQLAAVAETEPFIDPSDVSAAALNADLSVIDEQISDASSAAAAIDAGMSDKPVVGPTNE